MNIARKTGLIGLLVWMMVVLLIMTAFAASSLESGYQGGITYPTINIPSTNPGMMDKSVANAENLEGVTLLSLPNQYKFKPPYGLVVILPGSGGVGKRVHYYSDELTDMGLATAIVDPYSPRGMKSLGHSQSGMTDASYVKDIFSALDALATHPDLDMDRVAAIGGSWGGGIQMYLASKWWTDTLGQGRNPIKLYLSLYPACYLTEENVRPSGGEILAMFGLKEDWNDPEPCRRYLARLEKSGAKVTVIDFPNGHHAWDAGYPVKTGQYVTYHCEAVWDNESKVLSDKQTGKSYDMKDGGWGEYWKATDCVKKQIVHYGGTREQRQRTLEIVKQYLKEKLL